jgi:hypothetical protein
MMGVEAYGAMMWVSPCKRCEQMVWGHAIDKVHRHMSLYELFGQSISPSHKKNVEEKKQQSLFVCLVSWETKIICCFLEGTHRTLDNDKSLIKECSRVRDA